MKLDHTTVKISFEVSFLTVHNFTTTIQHSLLLINLTFLFQDSVTMKYCQSPHDSYLTSKVSQNGWLCVYFLLGAPSCSTEGGMVWFWISLATPLHGHSCISHQWLTTEFHQGFYSRCTTHLLSIKTYWGNFILALFLNALKGNESRCLETKHDVLWWIELLSYQKVNIPLVISSLCK